VLALSRGPCRFLAAHPSRRRRVPRALLFDFSARDLTFVTLGNAVVARALIHAIDGPPGNHVRRLRPSAVSSRYSDKIDVYEIKGRRNGPLFTECTPSRPAHVKRRVLRRPCGFDAYHLSLRSFSPRRLDAR